ncbi:PASTA domain-containing protein [uncultured Adlercreutzia sp.]|uniref:PASTA domain-containing protein n=1 Tax=uncultured Adlercreutzia sp. TaxID=875803 RepID=UPI0026774979|nr:PASTA domain-containing protein [uncultured Adlercreutzia sp.]
MKCPHCSFDNKADAPFCEECGHVFLASDRIPDLPDPAEEGRRRDAALGGVPAVLQVPDIDVAAAKPARPYVPEVVPSATGPQPRASVADLADHLPDPPREPDFSGFERLVDSSYVPPAAVNSAGDTAEIPVVREEYVPRARNYTLGLSPREQKKRERQQKRLERKFAKAQQKEEMRAAREEARAAADAAREERRAIAAAEREERLAAAAAAREERKAARAAGEGEGSLGREAVAAAATAGAATTAVAAESAVEETPAVAAERPVLELPGAETGIVPVGERGIESVSRDDETDGEGAALVPVDGRTVAMEAASSGELSPAAPGKTVAMAAAPSEDDGPKKAASVDDASSADEAASTGAGAAAEPKAPSAAEAKAAAREKAKAARRASREKERAAKQAAKEKRRAAKEAARKASAPSGNAAAAASRARAPRAKWPIAMAAVVVLALAGAAAAWGTYAAEMWGGKTVPSVVGMTRDEAVAALEAEAFAVEATEVKSDEAAGTVLSESPSGGSRIEEGSTIALEVAVPRIVPEVAGLSQQEAADALAAEGLSVVEVGEEKSNEAAGTVLAVTPEAGSEVLSTDTITLTVAVPFTVPDVAGLDADAAKEALAAEGYEVETRWSYTEDVPEGTALSTDPEAGTELDTGSEVTLYLAKSRGNELVALAESFLPGARLKNDTGRFIIDSVKSVTYAGDDVVRYTCEAHQYEDVELPFGKGTTRVEDDKRVTIEGSLTFNSDDVVTTADPAIKY